MMFDRTELAWAAGFFDGEGCVWTPGPDANYLMPRLHVAQKDLPTLQRYHRAIGGMGRICPQRRPHYDDIWQWQSGSFVAFQATASCLWPFLSPLKRDPLAIAMRRYAMILDERRAKYDKLCGIEECSRRGKKREMCEKHYARWYRTGSPLLAVA